MIRFTIPMAATIAALAAATGGCAPTPQEDARYMAGNFRAQADLRTADGRDAGKAVADEVEGGIRVTISAINLPKGPHGAHVHTTGKCDAPDFTTAGGHWNPMSTQHGLKNPQGAHAGDMPNLEVASDGKGKLTFELPAGTFAGLLDEDGAALVIHAGPDDMKTDPSGNSGGRIACGVFAAM